MEIKEFDDQLVIRAELKHRVWCAVGVGAIGAGVVVAMREVLGWRDVSSIFAGVAALSTFRCWVDGRAELRVSKLEFVMRGGGKKTPKSVCLADVEYLQWEEGARRHPEGLYARVGLGSTCLLPYVNAQEVTEIIGRIGAKFPHCRL
jgi:hypothetical protein